MTELQKKDFKTNSHQKKSGSSRPSMLGSICGLKWNSSNQINNKQFCVKSKGSVGLIHYFTPSTIKWCKGCLLLHKYKQSHNSERIYAKQNFMHRVIDCEFSEQMIKNFSSIFRLISGSLWWHNKNNSTQIMKLRIIFL